MARYTGPMTKKSRRLGVDLVGGDAAYERRPYPPGQHGRGRIKESEYLLQLREKQKARFTYGVLENAGYPRLSMFWVWGIMGFTWGAHACLRCLWSR